MRDVLLDSDREEIAKIAKIAGIAKIAKNGKAKPHHRLTLITLIRETKEGRTEADNSR